MKITIKVDDDLKEDPVDFVITNESLDNYNFVDIQIGTESVTVPIVELFSALTAFKNQREIEREDL